MTPESKLLDFFCFVFVSLHGSTGVGNTLVNTTGVRSVPNIVSKVWALTQEGRISIIELAQEK